MTIAVQRRFQVPSCFGIFKKRGRTPQYERTCGLVKHCWQYTTNVQLESNTNNEASKLERTRFTSGANLTVSQTFRMVSVGLIDVKPFAGGLQVDPPGLKHGRRTAKSNPPGRSKGFDLTRHGSGSAGISVPSQAFCLKINTSRAKR